MSVDFAFFQTPELVGYLEAAGWHIEETTERDPYPLDFGLTAGGDSWSG